ncbi:MAG: S1 family peptidase [Polyangiaceae bacterium]|nr:S1 family peptidase [Polyangiaceae bacterium]
MTTRCVVVVVLLSLFGCSAASSSDVSSENVGQTTSPVISGTPSDESQNSVVLLVHLDLTGGVITECTGTLLAPKLVLTARHCVAATDDAVACDIDGNPSTGAGSVQGNYAPDSLYIFTGQNAPKLNNDSFQIAPRGVQILDDGATNLCNNDIALVVLDTAITDMPISPVRLDSDVEVGELVTVVGWGVTETDNPAVRQQRTGVEILGVGPQVNQGVPIPPNEFEVGESICSGDSGGPAFASTGAVVGIVSRGGNDKSLDPNHLAATCTGAKNIYTKLSPFKDFILRGYTAAGADPWLESRNSEVAPGGCSASPAEQSGSGVVVVAIAAVGFAVARRRRARD